MAQFKVRSLKFNFVMNLVLTGSSVFFPLITFPFVSRALLSDGYGLASWAISIASWFSLVAMLGVGRYGIREVAKNRDDAEKLAKITYEIFVATLVSTLISLLCFLVALVLVERFAENRTLLLINGVTIACNTLGVAWFFQGIEQYMYITIRGIAIKVVCFVGVIALVHTPDDLLIYAALVVLASAIANIINFVYMNKILARGFETKAFSLAQWLQKEKAVLLKAAVKHYKQLFVFFGITAAISVYTMLDTVMLGFLSSNQETGFYSAAANVKSALVGVVSALTGVLLPRASHMLAVGKKKEYFQVIRKVLILSTAVSILVAVALHFTATPLISWYAGASFEGAGPPLMIMGFAIIPISLSVIFCDAMLVPLGEEKKCLGVYIAAACISFGLNLLLIPLFGAVGAAASMFVVESFIAICEAFLLIRMWLSRSNA